MVSSNAVFQLKEHLDKIYPGNSRGYGLSNNNEFAALPKSVFDTPMGIFDRKENDSLPRGHSDALVNEYSNLISNAKYLVDIVDLGDINGSFRKQLFQGIKNALYNGIIADRLIVRIVLGLHAGPFINLNARKLMDELKDYIGFNKKLAVYIGVQVYCKPHRTSPDFGTWNHAKYVAVDSKQLLTGGHNWWADPYFGERPPFDLSIRLNGPVAEEAHKFTDFLMRQCKRDSVYDDSIHPVHMIDGDIKQGLGEPVAPPHPNNQNAGATPVLAVAQNGDFDSDDFTNPSLASMYWAIRHARKTVNITQMSLASKDVSFWSEFSRLQTCGKVDTVTITSKVDGKTRFYNVELLRAIAAALKAGAKVNILISNSRDAGDYSNGDDASSITRAVGKFAHEILDRADTLRILSQNLQVKTVMTHGSIPWQKRPNQSKTNHAKFWAADNLFYVGSHNMYPSVEYHFQTINGHLSEWGVIMGDTASYNHIMSKYFNPIWEKGHLAPFEAHWLP